MVDHHHTRYSETPHHHLPSRFSSSSCSAQPSFSSTLLDAIYRSIDRGEEDMGFCREPTRKNSRAVFGSEEEMASFQRACMVEKWMEKKVTEKVAVGRKSTADVQVKKSRRDRENLSSSSSDSSGGGFFSSSEAEYFPVQRPKSVRTGGSGFEKEKHGENRRDGRGFGDQLEEKEKREGGFLKTKSRALKIYGDLKRVKQPISPGGKLAGFLNSLFSAGNLKKPKVPAGGGDDSPSTRKSTNASTCSSASTFSRSCFSKAPSCRGKSSGGAKRSVRFFPVSVIVDEDCQPCGHKSLHQENKNNNIHSIKTAINEDLMRHILEKNRRAEEAARDFLMNYQNKREFELPPFDHLRKTHVENQGFDQDFDEEDDDFDATSDASSDLFELDNLSAIGMERYREELPVYETTYLDTNRAISNGLIL
ncbi:protein BIG GRAIN 1-like B [Sesamum alatum]|uniref:Protein BIG GRAIN 1-like B n=1 Tax=Sesamum alatum TaxID=300844 RepID=A0AAE2C9A7_9LAMI|nr:protein BIG GRAIN 1-like B [Sesamum alatum]